jgi:hypothetical protein
VQKKRPYTRQIDAERASSTTPKLKRLEELTRLTFLLTFDVDACVLLVARVFPEHIDHPEDAWLIKMATDRVRGNCRTWKSLTVRNMRVSSAFFYLLSANCLLELHSDHP